MPFFDFHCHPGLKPTFAEQTDPPSPWDFISAKLKIFANVQIGINPLFNDVLNSQSCLGQLYNGQVKLFGIALHAPESNMGKGLLEKHPVNAGAIPLIDPGRLSLISQGNSYFDFTLADLERLVNTPAPSALPGARLAIVNSSVDFNEGTPNTIFGFLIVEGLHCFFENQTASDANQVFTRNFESFTDQHTVIAINVCHLQQNDFCNHAFGIQFIKPEYFFPTQNGITDWGNKVISRMLEKNILIDIKHMSLWSRWQLYSRLNPSDGKGYTAPIICTHAGLTGQTIKDRVKYLLSAPDDLGTVYEVAYLKPKSPYIEGVYFNCSSINLYDEDVENILLSGGLIGLSFDKRILGFADENVLRDVTNPNDVEYISKLESDFFLGPSPANLPVYGGTNVWSSEDFEDLDPSLDSVLQPMFFLSHVLHILTIAKNNTAIGFKKALTMICIGTDYDGLINTIDNCKQADQLEGFKQLCLQKLPGLLKNAGFSSDSIDVPSFVNGLFYTNGRDFIMNRLKAIGK